MKLPDRQPDIHLDNLFYTQLSSETALEDLIDKLDRDQEWFALTGATAMMRARFPHHVKGFLLGAKAHRHILEWLVADQICLDGIRRFPDRSALYEAYATNAQHQRRWGEAIDRWKNMRKHFPDVPVAYFQEATAYRQMGDYRASDRLINEVITQFPAEVYQASVVLAHSAKDRFCLEEALERWLILLNDYSDQLEIYTNIVSISLELYHYNRGEKRYLRQARKYLDEALTRFPNHRRVLLCEIGFLNKTGSSDKAQDIYATLRKRYRSFPAGYFNPSRIARSKQDYDMALALLNDYRPYAKTFQQTFDIESNVFQVLLAKKDFEGAIAWLNDLGKSRIFFSTLPQAFYGALANFLLEYFWQKQDANVDDNIRLILRLMLHQCLPDQGNHAIPYSLSILIPEAMPRSLNLPQSKALYQNMLETLSEAIDTFKQTIGITDSIEYLSIYYNFISDSVEKRRLYFKIFDQFPLMWGRLLLSEKRPFLNEDGQYFIEWVKDRFDHQLTTLSPDRIFNACQMAWTINQDLYLDMLKKAVNVYSDKELPAPISGLKQILDHRTAGLERSKKYRVINDKAPLRIAVCISGQLRGFREAFPTWKKMELESQGHHVDYFIHTWKKVGGTAYSWRRLPRTFKGSVLETIRVFPQEVQINLKRLYPHFYEAALSANEEVDVETLSNFYGAKKVVIEDEESDKIKALNFPGIYKNRINFSKMFYGMEESFKLLEGHEVDYDLVIRMRPDLFIDNWKTTDWHAIYKDSVEHYRVLLEFAKIVHIPPNLLMVGDIFAVGTYSVMKQYYGVLTDYFSNRQSETHKFGMPFTLHAHESLAYKLLYGGVLVRAFREQFHLTQPFTPAKTLLDALLKDMAERSLPLDTELLKAIEKDLAKEANEESKA